MARAGLKPLPRFLGLVALVWVLAWLPLGLYLGDPDFVLTRFSRDTWARQLYQILFYSGLGVVFLETWWRHRPRRPSWGRARWFWVYFAGGLGASFLFRGVLVATGTVEWSWKQGSWWFWTQIAVGCLVVGLVEEAIFRGFLLPHLVERFGWFRGLLICSLVFAAVHLFRPGPLEFRFAYGFGLFLLGCLLAQIAWRQNSLWASAGFHSGLIGLNLCTHLDSFRPSFWSGLEAEPVSGLVSWLLTLGTLDLVRRVLPFPSSESGPRLES